MAKLFKMAWRNMWRNWRRTAIALTAIVLGLILLLLLNGMIQGSDQGIYGNAVRLYGGNVQVHAPGYRPGMFQQGGPGFLGSAARVAVGVAGGMLLGSAIASMLGMGGAAHAANPDALATSNPVEPGALDDGLAKQPAYDSSDVASADLSGGDSGGDDEMF